MNNIYLLIAPVMVTLVETAPTIKHRKESSSLSKLTYGITDLGSIPSVEPVICFFILFEMLTLKMSEVEE
jgi:hypothetical protein